MHLNNKYKVLVGFFVLLFLAVFSSVHALSVSELQNLINQKQQEKLKLDEENKKLNEQIVILETEAKTLSTTVKSLDQNAKKIGNDIKITKTNISSTQYQIQQLEQKIDSATERIGVGEQAVARLIKRLSEVDDASFVENFLSDKTLADIWDEVEVNRQLSEDLNSHIAALTETKKEFTEEQAEYVEKKTELTNYQSNLTSQQKIVLETQAAKTKVLVETKNKESEFQKQLQANLERGRQIEQEQFAFESQLQIAIDPSKLPKERPGIISWPLDSIKITQKFGATVDAKRLYVSGTHNGIDFRASMGTPVKAVLSGTVQAMGNTDDQRGCYSYGRWILIKHNNGLSSLYAHLSGANVRAGQEVTTGQVIGYSGGQPGVYGSGFSTGPHLHLGLFASQAVNVQLYSSSKFCKSVVVPTSPLAGYLDPSAYLPTPF